MKELHSLRALPSIITFAIFEPTKWEVGQNNSCANLFDLMYRENNDPKISGGQGHVLNG